MGQSSVIYFFYLLTGEKNVSYFFSQDQAHLPDERISLINLQKGKAVVERFIVKVANEVST